MLAGRKIMSGFGAGGPCVALILASWCATMGQNAPKGDKPEPPKAAAPATPASQPTSQPAPSATPNGDADLEAAKRAALESIRNRERAEAEAKAAAERAADEQMKKAAAERGADQPAQPPAVNPTVTGPTSAPVKTAPSAAPATPIKPPPSVALPGHAAPGVPVTPADRLRAAEGGPPLKHVSKLGHASDKSAAPATTTPPPGPPGPPAPAGGRHTGPGKPGPTPPGGAPPAAAGGTPADDPSKVLPDLEFMANPPDPNARVYAFDYDNTPWVDVLGDFARASGLTLIGDVASVSGPVSFRSPKNFTYKEAMHELNDLLLKRPLDRRLLERHENYLELWRLPDRIKQIPADKMFDTYAQFLAANLDEYDMCITNVDPPPGWTPFEIIEQFRTYFDDYYGTQVNGSKVQLSGMVKDHKEFVAKIDALTKMGPPPPLDVRPQLIIPLKFSKANDMQTILRGIYPAAPPGPPRPGVDPKAEQAKQITILANVAANSIIAKGPQAVLTELSTMVQQFDVGTPYSTPIIKNVKLKYATAMTLQGTLKPIAMREGSEMIRPGGSYLSQEAIASKTWDIIPDAQTNSVILYGGAEGVARGEKLVADYDVPDTNEKMEVVELQHGDAPVLATTLAQLYPPQTKPGMPSLRVKPDGDKRLIILGAEPDVQKVAAMARQLDTPNVDDKENHFVTLKNVKPSQMAALLSQLFGSQPGAQGVKVIVGKTAPGLPQTPGGPVRFLADDATMMLTVVCDTEEWAKVEPLIQKFDRDAAAGKPTLQSFVMKHARARDVVAALQAMYPSLSGQPKPPAPGQQPQVIQTIERIWEDSRDGSIQVYANAAFIEEITPLIAQLDVESRDGMTVIKLENAPAAEVATIVQQAFGAAGAGAPPMPGRAPGMPVQPGAAQVRIVPEPITNSLLVTAEPKELERITALVADIDKQYEEKKAARVILTCEHRPATEVADVLNALAGAARVGSPGTELEFAL